VEAFSSSSDAEDRFPDLRPFGLFESPFAVAGDVLRGVISRLSALRLESNAHRDIAGRDDGFRAKALVRRTTTMGGSCRRRSWQKQWLVVSDWWLVAEWPGCNGKGFAGGR